jgi:hypothetical protein
MTEDKRTRGQPRGYIQYPNILTAVKAAVTDAPKTAGEIQQEVVASLTLQSGPGAVERGASKDTIRKYLNRLVDDGSIQSRQVGKSGQLTVYSRAAPVATQE